MSTLPAGVILILGVLFFAAQGETASLYFNAHAMVVVCGGTFAILILSTPLPALKNLVSAVLSLLKQSREVAAYSAELERLSTRKEESFTSTNPLITYGAGLWESGVSSDSFISLLSQKRAELENSYMDAIQALRNLSKYPPALGMLGTVMGLVALFSKLGVDRASLGPALALAMTATFYGLLVANAVISPLADRLHVAHLTRKRLYTATYQMLILINRGEHIGLAKINDAEKNAA
ncbi:MAG: MotA/TolQ/ExbB proton channel family protein [Proteobacteria bacterium]|nr:MotA/TolQ/ExbB proton channel family protein [Pseudomonadota bacterium]